MYGFARIAAAALVAGALLGAGSAARAQDQPRPVIIGNSWLFLIRNSDNVNHRDWSIQDRIDHIQDVFAKYLGGPQGKFTTKKYGDRVHIYLNGDYVLAVNPADAKTCGCKTAERLAAVWVPSLKRGFDEGHVQVAGPNQ